MAYGRGLLQIPPEAVAELGPGDSIGTGLAALLAGAKSYHALDLVRYSNTARDLEIFEDLLELYRERSAIPDEKEFPHVGPRLESYQFPADIITDERLEVCLQGDRLNFLRDSIRRAGTADPGCIAYIVPWYEEENLDDSSFDLILSQAVFEHVDDLPFAYQKVYRWLKPGGIFSQEIDFTCHGTAREWNGHWRYSPLTWKLIRGKRSYLINRQPLSVHRELLTRTGFRIASEMPSRDPKGIRRRELASEFREITDEDLSTYSCFIQAVK
jgi:SAM-dependent methyltransferase